jgi:amino acid transporter
MGLLRTKSIEESIRDTEEPEHQLRKDLSALDLTVFGIGVIIGTGIFVLTGIAAATTKAGPAISLSFVAAGIACGLAALCYAEFASTVPVAGSAYTFSYAALGSCWPGSSAGTWCWSSRWARPPSRSAGRSSSPRWCRSRRPSPGRARSTWPPARSC